MFVSYYTINKERELKKARKMRDCFIKDTFFHFVLTEGRLFMVYCCASFLI
jgi:hypothetical protein